jgi:hypothetical protein
MRTGLIPDRVDTGTTAAIRQAALGYGREDTSQGRHGTLSSDGPDLGLLRVPEPKRGKNRRCI